MKDAIVTADVISIRTGRGQDFPQLGTYKKDDRIIVLDSALDQDYAMVLWQAGYAYSNKVQYISFYDPQSPDLSGSVPNANVTANSIVVREGRGSGFAALGEYPLGSCITVLDQRASIRNTPRSYGRRAMPTPKAACISALLRKYQASPTPSSRRTASASGRAGTSAIPSWASSKRTIRSSYSTIR